MNDEQIRKMVNRFLSWKLPQDFSPDGGISYTPIEGQTMPFGTNLLTATQAEELIRYITAK